MSDNRKEEVVYILQCGEYYKIGRTNNLKSRLSGIQTGNPNHVEVVYTKTVDSVKDSKTLERYLHNTFRGLKVRGEWFLLNHSMLFCISLLSDFPTSDTHYILNKMECTETTKIIKKFSKDSYDLSCTRTVMSLLANFMEESVDINTALLCLYFLTLYRDKYEKFFEYEGEYYTDQEKENISKTMSTFIPLDLIKKVEKKAHN